jgi:hypothetical protein
MHKHSIKPNQFLWHSYFNSDHRYIQGEQASKLYTSVDKGLNWMVDLAFPAWSNVCKVGAYPSEGSLGSPLV